MDSIEITKVKYDLARDFFLKEKKYINFDIPPYFSFDKLLKTMSSIIENRELGDICKNKSDGKKDWPKFYEKVNYLFLANKDGSYAWRPLQLIHPVLYVDLVNIITKEDNWNQITKRFNDFSKSFVECIS